VYRRDVDGSSLNVNYRTSTLGGAVRFGVPFTEYDSLYFGMSAENVELELDSSSPLRYLKFRNEFGSIYDALIGTAGWVRDTRDSAIWPTRGRVERATFELGTPLGELEYWKYNYTHQHFYPFSPKITFVLSGELDSGDGYHGKPLPFFKNYYSGGIGSVRGYQTASLGPRDIDGTRLGGNRKVNVSMELLFPAPGATIDRSMRLGAFLDAGQVYGVNEQLDLSQMRSAAGLSFAWNSPVGPMKFSVARALNARPGDDTQPFQFTLGQVF
jgi:outer membrane protein insertion porin family